LGIDRFHRKVVAPNIALGAGSIGTSEIADDAITSAKIASGAVNSTALASGAVSPAKANTALKTKVSTVYLGSISSSSNRFLMAAPYACTISKIGIIVDTQINKTTSNTTFWGFQVRNLTQSQDLMNSTAVSNARTDNATITADALYDLGVNQNLTLATGDVLELQMTASGSPNALSNLMAQVAFY
jgi:hypothetical protein